MSSSYVTQLTAPTGSKPAFPAYPISTVRSGNTFASNVDGDFSAKISNVSIILHRECQKIGRGLNGSSNLLAT